MPFALLAKQVIWLPGWKWASMPLHVPPKAFRLARLQYELFKSLRSPAKYGAYIARQGTAILYLTPGGKQLEKWGLNDGTLAAQLTAELAHLNSQSPCLIY